MMERRVLYRLLRMNWEQDPATPVEPWQVQDYRKMDIEALFKELEDLGIFLDRVGFIASAEHVDTPEQFAEESITADVVSESQQDHIYLLIFEIWRRLVPEKLCLSIFCDELDYQIEQYDKGTLTDEEALQDALAMLAVVLDENIDEGVDPQEAFSSLCAGCAQDVEDFLYNYIADQIDNTNESYASELLDDFGLFVTEPKWFDLLQARLILLADEQQARALMYNIVSLALNGKDLEYQLEILSILVKTGDKKLFTSLVNHTLSVLKTEEEFQDLLCICIEFFHYLDQERQELAIQEILKKRESIPLHASWKDNSSVLSEFKRILV